MTEIRYSRGKDKNDNKPRQRVAASWDAFVEHLDLDRAPAKGQQWIAGPFNGDGKRCLEGAMPRSWLPVDIDRIAPDIAPDVRLWFTRFSGVAWRTHSSTDEAPRERVLLELNRDATRDENIRIGAVLERDLREEFGDGIGIDASTFRPEQPNYCAPQRVPFARFEGEPLDVDAYLKAAPEVDERPSKRAKLEGAISDDPILQRLDACGMVREMAHDGRVWIDCPFSSQHTSPAEKFGTIWFAAHTNGYKSGHFKCLHQHCATRTDQEFLQAVGYQSERAERQAAAADSTVPFFMLDLVQLACTEPAPPAFVIPDWLPCGEVTLFAGHGGSGKSAIALLAAVCIASGRAFYGLHTRQRRVAFVSLEDGAEILHWRLSRISGFLGIDLASLAPWLTILDGTAGEAALMTETRDGAVLTSAYEWLRERANEFGGLVIDGASDAFDANENERRAVRRFVRLLRRLITRDGFVLLLAHVDKATAKVAETSQGYSGSTAWSNSVRARWYLRPEGENALTLEVQKANHAAVGASMLLTWSESAHLFVGELTMPSTKIERDLAVLDEREAVLAVVRKAESSGDPLPTATRGTARTAHAVASVIGIPASLQTKRATPRFYEHLEALRATGRVRVTAITRPNRHKVEVYRGALSDASSCASTKELAPTEERFAPTNAR